MNSQSQEALGSWSAMRKYLERDMLAPSLRGRVRYSCAKFPQTDEQGRFGIHVDGEPWKYFSMENIAGSAWDGAKPFDRQRYWNGYWRVKREIPLSDRSEFDDEEFADALAKYRSMPIGDALNSENPIVRLFAILDRRVGKRTLAKQCLSAQPPWLRPFYLLRLRGEGVTIHDKKELEP